eukprot:3951390-Lingulodinium_polyedra.AAC.1
MWPLRGPHWSPLPRRVPDDDDAAATWRARRCTACGAAPTPRLTQTTARPGASKASPRQPP